MIKIGKDISSFSTYSCQPSDKNELKKIIKSRIEKEGPDCNLNDIDTSLITDMSYLFSGEIFDSFNGNISEWDVSNVKYMAWMFYCSAFNGDISNWDVRRVKRMNCMFAKSKFNQDISRWNTKNVTIMSHMFNCSKFNKQIGNWDVSNVKDMSGMFSMSKFKQDISNWNLREDCNTLQIFYGCKIRNEYKPKSLQK